MKSVRKIIILRKHLKSIDPLVCYTGIIWCKFESSGQIVNELLNNGRTHNFFPHFVLFSSIFNSLFNTFCCLTLTNKANKTDEFATFHCIVLFTSWINEELLLFELWQCDYAFQISGILKINNLICIQHLKCKNPGNFENSTIYISTLVREIYAYLVKISHIWSFILDIKF